MNLPNTYILIFKSIPSIFQPTLSNIINTKTATTQTAKQSKGELNLLPNTIKLEYHF